MNVPGYDRITVDAGMMGGVACIRGHRMPVATILRNLAYGWTREQILTDWPWMESEDIDQALLYGASLAAPHDDAA